MKRALPVLCLLASHAFGAYTYSRSITVNAAQITGTLSNWTMIFNVGATAYLKTAANGGHVQNANGYDIAFFSDSGLTTALSCEQESYSATTGASVYWVKVPSIAVATVIYIGYGDASISTAQCTGGAFDSNTSLVLHYPNGSILSTTDSTGNNTVTNHGATAESSSTLCLFDGCADFAGASTQYMSAPNTASLELGTTLTIEIWPYVTLLPSCTGGACNQTWFDKRNTGAGNGYALLYNCNNAPGCTNNWVEFYLKGTITSEDSYWSSGFFARGQKQYVAATYNGTTLAVYFDAVLGTVQGGSSTAVTGSTDDASATLDIGALTGAATPYANGSLDELRISNVTRSAAWIAANWNSESNFSTFATIGSENVNGGVVANPSVFGIAVQ